MGKWATYSRKYKKSWESEGWAIGWLCQSDETTARCKVCKTDLRAHHGDLKKHSTCVHHKRNMVKFNPRSNNQSLLNQTIVITNEEKERDLNLAVYIATHTAIRSMDHLCEVLKLWGKGSILESLRMHRTKCGNLIKTVISPSLLEQTVKDIADKPYSLIIDESTDVAVFKYMCFCARYHSSSQNKVVTEYLGICSIERATAEDLVFSIKNFLINIKLDISNLIGLGTDGAANLCGRNHSVYTLLKNELPKLQLVRCVCHSLNNASTKAASELPSNIEFLCREIHNFFSCSPLRRSLYQKTFELLNTGTSKTFHQFVQLSGTRWLSRYSCVSVIVENWFELKTHFQDIVKREKCYTSRLIHELLCDNNNYLFLLIIKPVLYEMNATNLIFQQDNLNVGQAYDDLSNLLLFLCRKILKPIFMQQAEQPVELITKALDNQLAFNDIPDCDFGVEFYQAVQKLQISNESAFNVQFRAFSYLKTLAIEVSLRLPDNLKHFCKLKVFSPDCCLTQLQTKFVNLPFIQIFCATKDLGKLESQWNKLRNYNWTENYGPEVTNNINIFWSTVYNFQDAGGSYPFKDIAIFVLTLLSLPTSNAVVERVFSIMNAIKTKARNRLSFEMLNSIIRIRTYCYSRKLCCKNFVVTKDILSRFKSDVVYATTTRSESEGTGDNNLVEIMEIIADDLVTIELPELY